MITIRGRGAVAALALLLLSAPAAAQSMPDGMCQDLRAERAKYPESFAGLCTVEGDARCPLGPILNAVAYKYRFQGFGL